MVALIGVEPRRVAGAAFCATRSGSTSRGSRRDPRVRQDPLQQRLGQVSTRARAARGRGGSAGRAAPAERAHHDDAEAQLLGQRQDLALDLALARVVGDLDRARSGRSA